MQAETGIGEGRGVPEINSLADATSGGSHHERWEDPPARTACGRSRRINIAKATHLYPTATSSSVQTGGCARSTFRTTLATMIFRQARPAATRQRSADKQAFWKVLYADFIHRKAALSLADEANFRFERTESRIGWRGNCQ